MATVGWGRDGWNTGAWGTSPDAVAVTTGISTSALINNVSVTAPFSTLISGQQITSAVGNTIAELPVYFTISGQQSNTSTGTISFGVGTEVILTGEQSALELNFGNGWGREECCYWRWKYFY